MARPCPRPSPRHVGRPRNFGALGAPGVVQGERLKESLEEGEWSIGLTGHRGLKEKANAGKRRECQGWGGKSCSRHGVNVIWGGV